MADNMKTCYTVLIIALLACLCVRRGSSVTISIDPNHCMETVDKMVDFGCRPDSANAKAKGITMIQLTKGDKFVIAEVRLGGKATLAKGIPTDHVKVEGQIKKDFGQTFLRVRLLKPTTNDAGAFSCRLYFTDAAGAQKQDVANYKLIVNKYDEKTIVKELVGAVGSLESEEKKGTATLKALYDKATYKSAFSAVSGFHTYFARGWTVVFGKVIMTQGNGYDKKTGIFTAPITGLYSFHVTIYVRNSKNTRARAAFVLMANKTKLAALLADDYDTGDQSSISSVVTLKAGDKVKVQAVGLLPSTYIYSNWYSLFCGFLIKPL